MRYLLAALDLMGTILDQEEAHFSAFQEAVFEVLGISLETHAIVGIPGAVGGGDEVVIRLILQHLGITYTSALADRLKTIKDSIFDARISAKPLQFRESAPEALQWLREKGVVVAIATNTIRAKALPIYHELNLVRWIPEHLVVCAGDSGISGAVLRKKPKHDIVTEVIQRAGMRREVTVMFDDSVHGMRAASAAGVARIAMANFEVKSLIDGLRAEEPLAIMPRYWDLNTLRNLFGQ